MPLAGAGKRLNPAVPRSLSRTVRADEAHSGSRPAPERVTAGAERLPRPGGEEEAARPDSPRGGASTPVRAAAAGGPPAPLQVRREVGSGVRYSPSTFFFDSAAAVVAAAAAPGAASATAAPGAAALLGAASGAAGAAAAAGTGGAAGAGLAVLVSGASLMVPGRAVGRSAALGLTAPKMAPPKF